MAATATSTNVIAPPTIAPTLTPREGPEEAGPGGFVGEDVVRQSRLPQHLWVVVSFVEEVAFDVDCLIVSVGLSMNEGAGVEVSPYACQLCVSQTGGASKNIVVLSAGDNVIALAMVPEFKFPGPAQNTPFVTVPVHESYFPSKEYDMPLIYPSTLVLASSCV
ncbi:hypothetical protein RRF57_010655 [Xylaria bambusicola]|uniref:Uncharacterized protein n=1 Tax=Xylaria bambusicola TaxID=326684 RepID=A0AAN7ZD47_9PEZI